MLICRFPDKKMLNNNRLKVTNRLVQEVVLQLDSCMLCSICWDFMTAFALQLTNLFAYFFVMETHLFICVEW
jgi:hypothetical protein